MRRVPTTTLILVALPALLATVGRTQEATSQVADTAYVPLVEQPAYRADGPRVLVDEAHNNYHTTSGRYRPFADLLTLDGYRIDSNREVFAPVVLQDVDVLVIANAQGGNSEDDPDSVLANPAFTVDEVDAVRRWVEGGGALLLVADHAPSGAAAQDLAEAFGVEMRNSWTFDEEHGEPGYGKYNIAFEHSKGLLGDHPITRGRDDSERLNKVVAFTGQSLMGPDGSSPLLILSDSAMDEDVTETIRVSAAGRAQGVAFHHGNGRVVVLGEAAMLTAQQRVRNGEIRRYGISYADSDNEQFALNVMHWLTGLIR